MTILKKTTTFFGEGVEGRRRFLVAWLLFFFFFFGVGGGGRGAERNEMGWGAYWLRDNFGLKFWFGPASAAFFPRLLWLQSALPRSLLTFAILTNFVSSPIALSLFFDVIIAGSFVYCVLLWCWPAQLTWHCARLAEKQQQKQCTFPLVSLFIIWPFSSWFYGFVLAILTTSITDLRADERDCTSSRLAV